jgi:RNA recognition motif-containing protein
VQLEQFIKSLFLQLFDHACTFRIAQDLPISFTMSDKSRLKATVYIGGLDNNVTMETLHAAFIPFGDISDISLPKPELKSSTDLHRGFGYVEFELEEDAKEAIDNMDQSELYGRVIKVAPAKPQKDHNEGLGSKTAVWEQVWNIQTPHFAFVLTTINRKAIWQSMRLGKKIERLQTATGFMMDHWIQCKG